MKKRIFWSVYLLTLTCVILMLFISSTLMYREMYESMQMSVRRQTDLVVQIVDNQGVDTLGSLPPRMENERITVIAPDGRVSFDSRESPDNLSNHLERPEIKDALTKGEGEAKRLSETLQQSTFYRAVSAENGQIVRVSSTVQSIFMSMADSLFWLMILVLVMIFVANFVASKITNKLLEPINQFNVDEPHATVGYAELQPLVRKLQNQNETIQLQRRQIEEEKRGTTFFLENMQEGIILLDENLDISAVNSSAIDMLGARQQYYIDKNLLQLTRNRVLVDSAKKSQQGDYQDALLELGSRKIQLHSSPIWSEGRIAGVVCFLIDATEREQADRLRREFSATVSHELRTPLTSISGYAEIMKNGMVEPEDFQNFSNKIYEEAQGLVALIDDIMKLSQLDENGTELSTEQVDLYEIANQIVNRLQPRAAEKNITLLLEGEPLLMEGVPALLGEIIYNLVDNSLKYSEQGTVELQVEKEGSEAILQVKDQGIGIGLEHQKRVFERFYREDGSHSKSTGGTGLGLAIVKHGVKYHGGKITLESIPQQGTTITIQLPIK